jgi:sulfonate transport system substrate-binding protein
MRVIAKSAGFLLAVAMMAGIASAAAEPLKIRVGWATTPTHVQPIVDELQKRHPEIFVHFGKSYVAQGSRFQGSTPQIQALAIGELEIAAFAPSAFSLAVTNAKLDIKVVADVFQDGKPDYGTVTYVVRADSPIKTVEQLRGKNIATNAIGSFGDSAMRIMMRKHGLADRDFTSVETNFANMPAMLDDGKVDMINLVPQYRYMLTSGKYRLLFTAFDAEGLIEAQFWAMRADFIAAHHAPLVDFFEDHIRAVRWLLDPENHKEAVAITAAVTKAAPDTIDYIFTKADSYRAPDALPDIPALQHAVDNDVAMGVVPARIEIAPKYVDLSLVEEAKQRLDKK